MSVDPVQNEALVTLGMEKTIITLLSRLSTQVGPFGRIRWGAVCREADTILRHGTGIPSRANPKEALDGQER